jgi:hypothetical protein
MINFYIQDFIPIASAPTDREVVVPRMDSEPSPGQIKDDDIYSENEEENMNIQGTNIRNTYTYIYVYIQLYT